jgi:hypothetical protein
MSSILPVPGRFVTVFACLFILTAFPRPLSMTLNFCLLFDQ